MSNGFNAPRVIGQGSVQTPIQVDTLGDIAESYTENKKWSEQMDETKRQYDQNYYMAAVDQNLNEKWLQHRQQAQAFKEYEQGETKTYPKNDPQGRGGQAIPFDEWYQDTYGEQTGLVQANLVQNSQNLQNAKNNPLTHHYKNPYVGGTHEKTPEGTVWHPSSGKFGIFSDVGKKITDAWGSVMGEQEGGFINYRRGNYVSGNKTGDTNPAMLEDGEYVLNRNAVDKLGKGFLDYINNERYPRFQSGGFKSPAASGQGGKISGPKVLEETAFDALTSLLSSSQIGTGSDPTMDYGSLKGWTDPNTGLQGTAQAYDQLVTDRQSAWNTAGGESQLDPEGWQRGGMPSNQGFPVSNYDERIQAAESYPKGPTLSSNITPGSSAVNPNLINVEAEKLGRFGY